MKCTLKTQVYTAALLPTHAALDGITGMQLLSAMRSDFAPLHCRVTAGCRMLSVDGVPTHLVMLTSNAPSSLAESANSRLARVH